MAILGFVLHTQKLLPSFESFVPFACAPHWCKKRLFLTPLWAHFQPLAQLHKLQGLNTSVEPIINFCVSLCPQGCLPLVIFPFLYDLVRSWLNSSSSRTIDPKANLCFWVFVEAVLLWWWSLRWDGFCLSEYGLGYSGGQFLFFSVAWAG